jgi:hypothetical protein
MEGFSLYFWSIFAVSVGNVWLLFAIIVKIAELKIRWVILFLISLILVVINEFYLMLEIMPFSTLKNASITLLILVGLHTVVVMFNRKFRKDKVT